VSFTLRAGERLALVGPSGSGKTTLLNCLGGVDRPDSGSIRLHGEALETLSSDGLARLRRQRVGTIFQFFHLLPTLTAAENVEFPLQLIGTPPSERTPRVAKLLERVGVAHRAHALPSQLSGGEMQRVAVARALITRPKVMIADEPTGNLDKATGEAIFELLKSLVREQHLTVILTTHNLALAYQADRIISLEDGRIVKEEHGRGSSISKSGRGHTT
jgi:ABC-type lipoprotein export system ATPase subunit